MVFLLLQFLLKNAFLDALPPPGRLRPARAGKIGKRALTPEWSFFTTVSSQKCIFGCFAASWPPPPRQGGKIRKTRPGARMVFFYYSFFSKMHFWTLCGLLAASTPPGREKSENAPWRQNGCFLLQFLETLQFSLVQSSSVQLFNINIV